jgi:hypothetical protein
MAKVTCAISGVTFNTDFFESPVLNVRFQEGYFHPIFAAKYADLYRLYYAHCKGQLKVADSYLLFLAFLHSSGSIIWESPASLDPMRSSVLVENNFSQLVAVLEKTNMIQHDDFSQPKFKVAFDNSKLQQISNWIKAWEDNLYEYRTFRADIRSREKMKALTAKLSYEILSGSDPKDYAQIIADWAAKAGDFPPDKTDLYKKTIKDCFFEERMFRTPLALLKELKDYCECNIEAGSIHFHTVLKVIKSGIHKHVDYLGGNSLSLGYTLLSNDLVTTKGVIKTSEKLDAIIAKATDTLPIRADYPDAISFIRAKLAYKIKISRAEQELKEAHENEQF